jgi:hypothetical protein
VRAKEGAPDIDWLAENGLRHTNVPTTAPPPGLWEYFMLRNKRMPAIDVLTNTSSRIL